MFAIQNALFDTLGRFNWRDAEPKLGEVLDEFEAEVRADERVKATAEAYEKVGRTFAPRGSAES